MDDFYADLVGLLVCVDHLKTVDVCGGDILGSFAIDALHDFAGHCFGNGRGSEGKASVGAATAVKVGVEEQVESHRVAQQNFSRVVLGIEIAGRARLEIEHSVGKSIPEAFDMFDVHDVVAHLIHLLGEGTQFRRGEGVFEQLPVIPFHIAGAGAVGHDERESVLPEGVEHFDAERLGTIHLALPMEAATAASGSVKILATQPEPLQHGHHAVRGVRLEHVHLARYEYVDYVAALFFHEK